MVSFPSELLSLAQVKPNALFQALGITSLITKAVSGFVPVVFFHLFPLTLLSQFRMAQRRVRREEAK